MTLNSGNAIGNVGIKSLAEAAREAANRRMSDVTRYLAAAAHSDAKFRYASKIFITRLSVVRPQNLALTLSL